MLPVPRTSSSCDSKTVQNISIQPTAIKLVHEVERLRCFQIPQVDWESDLGDPNFWTVFAPPWTGHFAARSTAENRLTSPRVHGVRSIVCPADAPDVTSLAKVVLLYSTSVTTCFVIWPGLVHAASNADSDPINPRNLLYPPMLSSSTAACQSSEPLSSIYHRK